MPRSFFFLAAIAAVLAAAAAATAAAEPEPAAPAAEASAVASPGTTKPDTAPADAVKSGVPAVDSSKDGTHQRYGAHRVPAGGVETSVRRLTRALDLDATQQARLRELLESERRQVRQVWSDSASAAGDRTGPTLAILERTRDQIRSMLTEEQRKKYQTTVPREMTAPAQTDVDYWLRRTQPAGPKAGGKNPAATDN